MCWASTGEINGEEDPACSLFGLSHINLPLIYGKGINASLRLQLEIIRFSSEESRFARRVGCLLESSLLAPNLQAFKNSNETVSMEESKGLSWTINIEITFPDRSKIMRVSEHKVDPWHDFHTIIT